MPDFTVGTLNLHRQSRRRHIECDLAKAMLRCDVLGMQENTRRHVTRALREMERTPGWHVFEPNHRAADANPIGWNTRIFKRLPERGFEISHDGDRRVPTPARSITWQALEHRATGHSLLLLNTHAINGYAKRKRRQRLRDRYARAHWQTVVDTTWRFADAYDAVVLVGDFNTRLSQRAEPWYPGVILRPHYRFDHGGSLDHVLPTRGSDLRERWHRHERALHSGHDLHYTGFTWR